MTSSIGQDEVDMTTREKIAKGVEILTYSTLTVVLGRFQPLHKGHELLIREALERGDKTLILIGSASESRNQTNPFTFEEREALIMATFDKEVKEGKLFIHAQDDVKYRDNVWLDRALLAIKEAKTNLGCGHVKLIGFAKDGTTKQCLGMFEGHLPVEYVEDPHVVLNATDIRNCYFDLDVPLSEYEKYVSDGSINPHVNAFLEDFSRTDDYEAIHTEFNNVRAYKKSWAGSPFPPVFVAVDGFVTWFDFWGKPHLLLIRRKSEVGNGKLAMPGGFLEVDENLYKSAVREVKEETTLDVLGWRLEGVEVIDDPKRSLRGRMLTHVHKFTHKTKLPPEVKGCDDAGEALWMPYDQIKANRHNFFADHYHIITKLAPVIEEF